jgi:hypothetical protein
MGINLFIQYLDIEGHLIDEKFTSDSWTSENIKHHKDTEASIGVPISNAEITSAQISPLFVFEGSEYTTAELTTDQKGVKIFEQLKKVSTISLEPVEFTFTHEDDILLP